MFKKFTAIVLSLIFGLSVGVSLPVSVALAADPPAAPAPDAAGAGGSANARDPNTLRVYYSESIGAGEEVYHLSWCEKAPAFGPVTCSQSLVDAHPEYKKVCVDLSSKDKNTIIEGVPAKGCLKEGAKVAEKIKYKIDGKGKEFDLPYYQMDPPSDPKCLEEIDNQAFIYGRKYAVSEISYANDATAAAKDNNNPNNIIGNVSWPGSTNAVKAQEYAVKAFAPIPENTAIVAQEAYEIVQCAAVDMLITPEGDNGELKGPDAAVARFKDYSSQFDTLIKAGCNNDNSKESNSLTPNAFLSCTLSERINGESGTDLLARYVGALYRWAAGVIGIISVLVIVVSGIQTTVDSGGLEKAKERIMQSLMGLVLLFLSALILYSINPTFFTG